MLYNIIATEKGQSAILKSLEFSSQAQADSYCDSLGFDILDNIWYTAVLAPSIEFLGIAQGLLYNIFASYPSGNNVLVDQEQFESNDEAKAYIDFKNENEVENLEYMRFTCSPVNASKPN